MNIIFFGNSKYSVIGARILHEHIGIRQVVTIPKSKVQEFALQNNIPFIEARKLDQETIDKIKAIQADFFVVEDYGLILPVSLLALPKYIPLNVHHSLLPKYRGPAPAPYAILHGEKVSGVTIIKMAQRVDAGDILAQKEYALKSDETTDSLLTELNKLGGEIIFPVLRAYITGKVHAIKQDESKATFTKYMKKNDGYIDINNPPDIPTLDRMIRAYYPWPTVWTKLQVSPGKWKIIKLLPENKIQAEGGKPMSIKDFLNGYPKLKKKIEKFLPINPTQK